MKLLEGLNAPQREAVETTEGPVLVLAGAGSGKTRVLTHRIAYILSQNKAKTEEILAVTFTNKAANEMKERISSLLGQNSHSYHRSIPWCGTFHSICVRILRNNGEKIGINNSFTIYDSTDSLNVIKESMDRLSISKKDFNPYAIRSVISSSKNELITAQQFTKHADGYFQETVAKIYPKYQEILRNNQALDFDDLIMRTSQLFDQYDDVLKKYKQIFKYVNVDEYQDTNHAQYYLIKQLTEKNICVVGDDDQSIYGFRGANIQNILSFENDFEDAKVIKLEQNYRSTQNILDAAHHVVTKNTNRRKKKLWTEQSGGDKIRIHKCLDESDEADWVAGECLHLLNDKKVDPNQIAILYRTNAQSRAMEEACINNEIPYKIVGSIRFYDRKEIKDIISYLRILVNPEDNHSLLRIVNTPRRGIGEKTQKLIENTARELGLSLTEFLVNESDSIDNSTIKNLSDILRDILNHKKEATLTELIKFILDRSGYWDFLNDGTIENQSRMENLKELISVASRYDEMNSDDALPQFLEDVALIEEHSKKEKQDAVTLMTVHASKGLEFKYIFLIGMEETLFPHQNSLYNPKEIEEERRLAYVAITRAKQKIHITHCESRRYYGKIQNNSPSRFIEDIPKKLTEISSSVISMSDEEIFEDYFEDEDEKEIQINLKPGDKVKHEIFGKGKVIEIDDSTVVIDFGIGKGKKELALEYARMEKI
ncbi:AAA family ATPase [Candidatus Dojkabacteria bacterium]|nr:AAA family ATPase [Candidatus Dojkabacteria bacterium]